MTETEAAARELYDVPAYKAAASLNYVIQNLSDEIGWKYKHPDSRVHVDFLREMRRAAIEAGEAYTAILGGPLVTQLVEALEVAKEAIRLTREYVGADVLPAINGWSWYDATVAIDLALKAAADAQQSADARREE